MSVGRRVAALSAALENECARLVHYPAWYMRHRHFLPGGYLSHRSAALYERAVGYYAAMANINAYHQPGVEAGKKAAGAFLDLMKAVRGCLGDAPQTADAIAAQIGSGADPESVFHILNHLAANGRAKAVARGASPAEDQFAAAS